MTDIYLFLLSCLLFYLYHITPDLITLFLLFKRWVPLIKMKKMMPTKIITTKGKKIVKTDITKAIIPSTIETSTVLITTVTTVLVPRTAKVVICVNEATPPPPITEILHVKNGSKSAIKEAVKIVPAITATGVANVFIKLSTIGI